MRISTSQIFQLGLSALLDQQQAASKTQLQIATGRRILTPADDPVGSVRILDLQEELGLTEQYQANSNFARARLGLEENALIGVGNLLHRVRELAILGNYDVLSADDRRSIATEVRGRLDDLLSLTNSRDPNGEYIFAGFQGLTQPFGPDISGNFIYSGDDGQRFLQIGPSRQVAISDSGTDVFRAIRNGNGTFATFSNPANSGSGVIDPGTVAGTFVADTYTITFTQALPTDPITYEVTGATSGVVIPAGTPYQSGATIAFNGVNTAISGTPANGDTFSVSPSANQDLLTTVQNLAIALESTVDNDAGRAQFHNALNRFLVDVDQGLDNILAVRTKVGARLGTLDDQREINADFLLQVQETLSTVHDVDYAEAATRLNQQLTAIEAAQLSFIRVQGLSLFNFLR